MNTKFTAQTDKSNKFTVDSAILYAEWLCNAAVANNDAPVKVKTALVGNGAPIELKGKSSKGKAPGNIRGNVYNNTFTGFLPIPDKVDPEAYVWFEVKLPKHGLKDESNKIPANPVIYLRKMEWDRKVVKRNDTVKLTIEFESGVTDETDATVSILEYDRDGNHDPVTSFMKTVKNQKIEIEWAYEYQEDADEIPTDAELKKYGREYNPPEYFFTVLVNGVLIGREQESGLLEFEDELHLQFFDEDGKPYNNHTIEVYLPDGQIKEFTTDSNGHIDTRELPPGPAYFLNKAEEK